MQRTDPDQGDEEGESHSPSFPGDPSVFAVLAAGLSVDLAPPHPHLHMGPGLVSHVSSGVGLTELK